MPQLINSTKAIKYLKQYLSFNKARGMGGECDLESFLQNNDSGYSNKYITGRWIVSPSLMIVPTI